MAVPIFPAVRPHFGAPPISSTITTTFHNPSITATGGIGQTKALSLKQVSVVMGESKFGRFAKRFKSRKILARYESLERKENFLCCSNNLEDKPI